MEGAGLAGQWAWFAIEGWSCLPNCSLEKRMRKWHLKGRKVQPQNGEPVSKARRCNLCCKRGFNSVYAAPDTRPEKYLLN